MPKIAPENALPILARMEEVFHRDVSGSVLAGSEEECELSTSVRYEEESEEDKGNAGKLKISLNPKELSGVSSVSSLEDRSEQGLREPDQALLAIKESIAAFSMEEKRLAARFALQELSERHPGKSVEVRIPFVGAVQIVPGLNHRRGTPPNVVEMDVETFLALSLGALDWEKAREGGKISVSGSRANISEYFPLLGRHMLSHWR